MKLDPESLNIKLAPDSFNLRSQGVFILASALVVLYVVWPTTFALAIASLLIGTPLFWFIFGSNTFHRLTENLPRLVNFLIRLAGLYVVAKLLLWVVDWFVVVWGAYGVV